jgi:hypothetical protein
MNLIKTLFVYCKQSFYASMRWRRLLIPVLAGLASTAAGQSFAPLIAYSSGTYVIPLDVVLADINGDAKPDILLAGGGSNAAGVLLNTGSGTFQPVVRYSTGGGSYPQGIAVNDVNSDGQSDIITANYLGNSISVLPGNGNGTFQAAVAYATGSYSAPADVAVGDINSDGKLDIITANYNNATVGVFINNGNGTFQPIITYSAGPNCNPISVVATDVNGDGKADIITGNYFGNAAGVLLNDGYGSFQPIVLYPTSTGDHTHNVAVADLNSDGRPDIITANTNNNAAGVMLGNGNGTFQSMVSYVIGPNQYGYDIAVADITGDTKPDLVVVNGSSNAAEVLPGNGNGTFQLFSLFGTGSNSAPNKVAVADLNGDNKPDIVTGNNNNNTVSVLFNATVLATQSIAPRAYLDLWPNPSPAGEAFTLSASSLPTAASRLEATLFNLAGQRVFSSTLPVTQGSVHGTLSTTGLPPGLYMLRLTAYDPQGLAVGSLPARQLSIE